MPAHLQCWWLGLLLAAAVGARATPCDEVHMKCMYRAGCSSALRKFMVHCSGLGSGSRDCPEACQHALIALASTKEGKALMSCKCNDERCQQTKERVEVCRPKVLEAALNVTVSCNAAQWICIADTSCSAALRFYNDYCRSMFQGKRCSNRCKNSIHILRRQEAAAKLDSCVCDGHEEYDCPRIRRNMEELCFAKEPPPASPRPRPAEPGLASLAAPSLGLLLATLLLFYR